MTTPSEAGARAPTTEHTTTIGVAPALETTSAKVDVPRVPEARRAHR
jgi:hypothetical protein